MTAAVTKVQNKVYSTLKFLKTTNCHFHVSITAIVHYFIRTFVILIQTNLEQLKICYSNFSYSRKQNYSAVDLP